MHLKKHIILRVMAITNINMSFRVQGTSMQLHTGDNIFCHFTFLSVVFTVGRKNLNKKFKYLCVFRKAQYNFELLL